MDSNFSIDENYVIDTLEILYKKMKSDDKESSNDIVIINNNNPIEIIEESIDLNDSLNILNSFKKFKSSFLKDKTVSSSSNLRETLSYDFRKNRGNPKSFSSEVSLIYKTLSIIPPTSVSVERVFSHGSYIVNKYRNRLSPKSLNCILFLRLYYNMKNKFF